MSLTVYAEFLGETVICTSTNACKELLAKCPHLLPFKKVAVYNFCFWPSQPYVNNSSLKLRQAVACLFHRRQSLYKLPDNAYGLWSLRSCLACHLGCLNAIDFVLVVTYATLFCNNRSNSHLVGRSLRLFNSGVNDSEYLRWNIFFGAVALLGERFYVSVSPKPSLISALQVPSLLSFINVCVLEELSPAVLLV